MIDVRRNQALGWSDALRRLAIAIAIVLMFAGAWYLIRTSLLYRLACFNLGNYDCRSLVDRAIIERHPDLGWTRDTRRDWSGWRSEPTRTYGGGLAACAVSRRTESGGSFEYLYRCFDGNLNLVGTYLASDFPDDQPRNRDDNGGVEILIKLDEFAINGRPNRSGARYAIVELNRDSNILISVIKVSEPSFGYRPHGVWTNAEHDNQHELEWVVDETTGNKTIKSKTVFKLRWQAPGILVPESDVPTDFQVWLAKKHDEVQFAPTQSIYRMVENALHDAK